MLLINAIMNDLNAHNLIKLEILFGPMSETMSVPCVPISLFFMFETKITYILRVNNNIR